jgi:hypothetical protein
VFNLLIEMVGRTDITNMRQCATKLLSRCAPFDAAQIERLRKAGLTEADLK